MTTKLTQNQTTALVLLALQVHAEGDTDQDGFRDVYLDNAFADLAVEKLSPHARAAHLGVLERAGVYKVVDGFAWGRVKVED